MKVLALLLALSAALISVSQVVADPKIVVHLVAHTHNDVGWLKTVDQYYVGLKKKYDRHAAVQYIFHTVIPELERDPSRRFVYVEQGFFTRWWRQQNDDMKARVTKLVAEKRLELVAGGYCMPDEAATHYVDLIDNFALGHRFIQDTFGISGLPRIGWQIDPFGHSLTQASLLTHDIGFDALFLGRIDYADSINRKNQSNMEFLWRSSPAAGDDNVVFTAALPTGGYNAPKGLCWDSVCNDIYWQDDARLSGYNVPGRVQAVVDAAYEQANQTLCAEDVCNIIWTMGEDFQYENGRQMFKALDLAIKFVNRDGRVKLQYSTPSMYIEAKNAEGLTYSTNVHDFFPYANAPFSYWSGYFSSRPALKRQVRTSAALLHTARQLEFFYGGNGSSTAEMWEAVSIAQHHDAVAGTSKQHVAYDYAQRMGKGQAQAEPMMLEALGKLSTLDGNVVPEYRSCPAANISVCFTGGLKASDLPIVVTLYNGLAQSLSQELVLIPWYDKNADAVTVFNSSNMSIASIIAPTFVTNAFTSESALTELAFFAEVPAMGYSSYLITATPSSAMSAKKVSVIDGVTSFSNDQWAFNMNPDTGLIESITDKYTGLKTAFKQEFMYYVSGRKGGQNGGAYVMQVEDDAQPISPSGMKNVHISTGIGADSLVQTAIDVDWVKQSMSYHPDYVEFIWSVGPLPNDGVGREVITRYNVQLENKGTWYSDNNGREFSERVRNYRPTWSLNVTNEPVAQNYVPVNVACMFNDSNYAVAVVVDRAQGCTSLREGELEFLLHRRLFDDDGKGLNEPLNETQAITNDDKRIGPGLVVTGSHRFMITSRVGTGVHFLYDAVEAMRRQQSRVYMPMYMAIAQLPAGTSNEEFIKSHRMTYSFIQGDLPANLEVITVQPINATSIILRIAHKFGVSIDYHPELSKPVTFDLANLFLDKFTAIEEVSLTTNQAPISQQKPRYQWKVRDNQPSWGPSPANPTRVDKSTKLLWNPQQIRTFLVSFE